MNSSSKGDKIATFQPSVSTEESEGSEKSLRSAVNRIMSKLIPSYVTLDEEALTLVTNCTTEFLSSIACEALTHARLDSKKNARGENVLYSTRALGYENYVAPLQTYLAKSEEHLQFCEICSQFSESQGSTSGIASGEKAKVKKGGRKRAITPNPENSNAPDAVPAPSSSSTGVVAGNGGDIGEAGKDGEKTKKKRKKSTEDLVLIGGHFPTQSEPTANSDNKNETEGPSSSTGATKGRRKGWKKAKNNEQIEATVTNTTTTPTTTTTTTKEKQNKGNRKDWLNPEFIEEFRKKMEEGLGVANPTSFLKTLSKQMSLPVKAVTAQFEELKKRKQEQVDLSDDAVNTSVEVEDSTGNREETHQEE